MAPLLDVRNVSRIFGGLKANDDVSFSVEAGTILGLIGPNGAGKTTLFNCITGFDPPTRGEVFFDGRSLARKGPDQVCKLGMVRTWQKVRPLSKLSVLDNAVVGGLCHAKSLGEAREIAHAQLQLVGLAALSDAPAGGLSIGQRKKLEVARALATGPRMVLLDEVLGGLNASEREEQIALILEVKRRGLAQIVIEHDMKAIMRVSDRVVVLNAGRKLAEGAPHEIAANPAVIEAYLGESLAAD
jgi:branched-chain amino acid transport system ATP-binding protein